MAPAAAALGDQLANAQLLQDLVRVLWVLLGEGPEEAEAAGDHHVAVGDGEVRVEGAAA